MRVLLAVGDSNLSKILRGNLVKANFNVMEDEVLHRNYMNEIIDNERVEMIIIHDIYLPSDLETKEEREEEILKFIEHWRIAYNDQLRVVYLCERNRDDPFLGNLVARNVLDIFYMRSISTKAFVEQVSQPATFSNVQRLGVGKYQIEAIEEDEFVKNETETDLEKDSIKPESIETKNEKQKEVKKTETPLKLPKISVPKITKPTNIKLPDLKGKLGTKEKEPLPDFEDDFIELMPIQKEIILRERVVGTVIVGVASVAPHLGATHTSISIATYLKQQGHSVALVEGNYSEDFERIHSLYEGEKKHLWQLHSFDLHGIDHYKFRDSMSLGDIFTGYEFVILDIGDIENTPYLDEFYRSHVKCIVCSGLEWKQHWLERLCQVVPEHDELIYVVPFATDEAIKDIEKITSSTQVIPLPMHKNPYETKGDMNKEIVRIMDGYLKKVDQKVVTKSTVLIACIASVAITTLVIGTFVLL